MTEPPKAPGLYIVTIANAEPVSVNAADTRIAARCIKVTRANCKFGKAKDLARRKRSYEKHFGAENLRFTALVTLEGVAEAERAVLQQLKEYRIVGPTGRRNEWLERITPYDVETIVFAQLAALGLPHARIGSVRSPN